MRIVVHWNDNNYSIYDNIKTYNFTVTANSHMLDTVSLDGTTIRFINVTKTQCITITED